MGIQHVKIHSSSAHNTQYLTHSTQNVVCYQKYSQTSHKYFAIIPVNFVYLPSNRKLAVVILTAIMLFELTLLKLLCIVILILNREKMRLSV